MSDIGLSDARSRVLYPLRKDSACMYIVFLVIFKIYIYSEQSSIVSDLIHIFLCFELIELSILYESYTISL